MSSWPIVRLGEISDSIDYGVTASAAWHGSGPKFLRITDIQDGEVDWTKVPWCDDPNPGSSLARLRSGDIVFARTGATTGKSFLIRQTPDNAVFASYLIRLRLGEAADPIYVSHYFQSQEYWSQVAMNARGAAQAGINATTLATLRIPLPPLGEQRRIAAVLDKADELRAKRRAAIAQLDTLTQSIFLDMFGDPATNPKGWQQKKISDVARVVTGNTPSRAVDAYYGDGIEWIKSDNINTPHYYLTEADERLTKSGELVARVVLPLSTLVTCIAGSPSAIGNAAMADRAVAFNQQINAIVPFDVDPHFIYNQILVGKALIQAASTSSMKGMVNKSRFENILLMCPPLAMQERFSLIVQSGQGLADRQRLSLTGLNALFLALQDRAFGGRV